MSDDPPFIVCTRESEVTEADAPFANDRGTCRKCGETVVVSKGTKGDYIGKHRVLEPPMVCTHCSRPDDGDTFEVTASRSTILELLDAGTGPLELAANMAAMELAQASHPDDPRVEELLAAINADPEKADELAALIQKKAMMILAELRSRN